MSIFKKIPKDNIVISPYTAHKKYTLLLKNYSASFNGLEPANIYGYESKHEHSYLKDAHVPSPTHIHARIIKGAEFNSGSENTTTNNFIQRSVHDSLQHMYYRSVRDLSNTFCAEPTFNEFRELNGEAQIISIPQRMFGDQIHPTDVHQTSVKIISASVELRDDGFGNLYDIAAGNFEDPLSVYRSMTGSMVYYVGFNEQYPYHKDDIGAHCPAFPLILEEKSRYAADTRGHTLFFNTGSKSKHGTGVMLTGVRGANIYDTTRWSYFRTKKHRNINFLQDEDFAVSLWCNLPTSQSDTTGLFNYILTSGQGDHHDYNTRKRWRSKFPFDICTFNQRSGLKEQWGLTFKNVHRVSSGRINIKNVSTHSFSTASVCISHASLSLIISESNTADGVIGGGSAGAWHISSGSFWVGIGNEDNKQMTRFVITGSITSHPSTEGGYNISSSADGYEPTIYVPSMSNSATMAAKIVEHFNYSSSRFAYTASILHISASYNTVTGELCFHSKAPTGSFANNNYSFERSSSAKSAGVAPSYIVSFSGGVGYGEPNHLRGGPSESAHMELEDALGTTVIFYTTTGSGDFTSQGTYPTISFHGGITSSAILMASQASARINQGILFGYTASGNPFPLLISCSAQYNSGPNYGARLNLSQSIPGSASNGRIRKVGINGSSGTNNTYAFIDTNKFSGGTGPYTLASDYTASYLVLTTRGPHFGGPGMNQPGGPQPAQNFEKHVFYWHTGSFTGSRPEVGTFETHSTTMIDLGKPIPGVSSGSHDYWNIMSTSLATIAAHPSFSNKSYLPLSFEENGVINVSSEITNSTHVSLRQLTGTKTAYISPTNHGNVPQAVSGSTTGPLFQKAFGPAPISSNPGGTVLSSATFSVSTTDGYRGIPGQILARRSDGHTLYQVSSSTMVTESWNHVIYQKTGSYLQLYVNNQLECAITASDKGQMRNRDDIYFGLATRMTASGRYRKTPAGDIFMNKFGKPLKEYVREYMRPVSGAFDEIRIFDKALNSDQRTMLYRCPNGTPYVGNVFYEHGLIAITHPSGAYAGIAKQCTMSFKNTYEIQEHEYTLNVKRGEYNFTMNPSIIEKTATGSKLSQIAGFVTETDWNPYISTIGLYNEAGQLLVVGKLSKAIMKEDGYDTTLVVRYDT